MERSIDKTDSFLLFSMKQSSFRTVTRFVFMNRIVTNFHQKQTDLLKSSWKKISSISREKPTHWKIFKPKSNVIGKTIVPVDYASPNLILNSSKRLRLDNYLRNTQKQLDFKLFLQKTIRKLSHRNQATKFLNSSKQSLLNEPVANSVDLQPYLQN